MNTKIAKTMLSLLILFISGFYVLKYILPDVFLLQITDPNILTIGSFIESNPIFIRIYYCCCTFLTFYLFVSAGRGNFKLKLKDVIFLVVATIINELVTTFKVDLAIHTSTSLMLLLSLLTNGKKEYFIPTFIIHGYLSQFLFSIRGFETIISTANIATYFVLSIECYIWLAILGIIFYLKEGKKDARSTTISKQNG